MRKTAYMKKNILGLLCSLVGCSLFLCAQDTTQLKRIPYKLTVAINKISVYEEELKEAPFVLHNNTIQLYPGETVFIEVDEVNGAIKNMKAIKTIIDSSKTLRISFTQSSNNKVHEFMMLSIENPFDYKLSFKTMIYLLQQKKWVPTSVLPVDARTGGFESWPEIITSIALGNWTFE